MKRTKTHQPQTLPGVLGWNPTSAHPGPTGAGEPEEAALTLGNAEHTQGQGHTAERRAAAQRPALTPQPSAVPVQGGGGKRHSGRAAPPRPGARRR